MIWARIKRVATSLFALSAAGAVGWSIAEFILPPLWEKIESIVGEHDIGTLLAIGGVLLLIVKDLLLALLKTRSYIWNGDEASHPKSGEAIVWLVEAIVATAILAVVFNPPSRDCPKDWTTCVASAGRLTPTCFRTCMRDREVDHLTAQITQVKDEIRLRFNAVDATLASLADSMVGFKDGVVDDVTTRMGNLISTHDAKTATTLNGIKNLLAGCTLTSSDECPPTPCPPTGGDCPAPPPPLEVKPRYTLLYENARLDEDGKVTDQSFGVKLESRHLQRLKLLTAAFEDCNHADAPVELNVKGFSSTAEFRFQPSGGTMPDSIHLNLETANLRGQLVGAYLKNEQGFVVHWERWSSEADMPRPYQGVEQQALNRTVFIDLKSAGACDFPGTNVQRPARLSVPGQSP